MKYEIHYTKQYLKSFKRMKKQNKDLTKLKAVIRLLANGMNLPSKYRDHPLKGDEKMYRECHIEGDWLLKYRMDKNGLILVLCDTGSHAHVLGL